MKNSQFFKILIVLIIIGGIFLRVFNLEKNAYFDADQENFAWTAVRILKEKKPTLIGIKAGEFPVFIGPLMYYLYSLFYLIFSMDPICLNILNVLFAFLTMVSIFFVANKVFGRKSGLFSLLIYSFAPFFIISNRQAWLPNQLVITSIWIFYALFKITKKDQSKWLVVLGLLLSLAFQLHLTAFLLWPIVILAILIKKVKLKKKAVILGLLSGFLGFLPVILFDLRHDFLNLKGYLELLNRTGTKTNIFLRLKDLTYFTLENELRIFSLKVNEFTLLLGSLFFIFWFIKILVKTKEKQLFKISFLWILIPFIIFLPISLHIPEYFFIISFPILIFISSFFLQKLSQKTIGKIAVFLIFANLIFFDTKEVFAQKTENLISLYQKKKTIEYILQRSEGKYFSVFYETDRGLHYGFDYLFYWKLGKVPEKKKEADFAIVVPWNYKNLKISKRFGGIGLIDEFVK